MPRVARIAFPLMLYHIISRGNNREAVFQDTAIQTLDFRRQTFLYRKLTLAGFSTLLGCESYRLELLSLCNLWPFPSFSLMPACRQAGLKSKV